MSRSQVAKACSKGIVSKWGSEACRVAKHGWHGTAGERKHALSQYYVSHIMFSGSAQAGMSGHARVALPIPGWDPARHSSAQRRLLRRTRLAGSGSCSSSCPTRMPSSGAGERAGEACLRRWRSRQDAAAAPAAPVPVMLAGPLRPRCVALLPALPAPSLAEADESPLSCGLSSCGS